MNHKSITYFILDITTDKDTGLMQLSDGHSVLMEKADTEDWQELDCDMAALIVKGMFKQVEKQNYETRSDAR